MWLTKLGTAAGLLLMTRVLAAGAYLVARQAPRQPQAAPATPRPVGRPVAVGEKQARTDLYGDPLPPGALARMGTVRLRHRYAQVGFSADGKTLLSAGDDQTVRVWDVKTGKQVQRRPLLSPGPRTDHTYSNFILAEDGKTVVGWRLGEGLHLWDTATGKEL